VSLFCLVHGSTQSPAGWKLLVSEMESRGHRCVCVDLPVNEPDASANRYADVIGDAVGAMESAIVVAHSAGGLFLPLVAGRVKVARLVYLASVIPEIGKSFIEQFKSAPEMYCPGFVGKDPTKDSELARHFLFHDCDADVADWAVSTLRLMFAKQAAIEITPLLAWPDVPVSYISCSEDRTINPVWWENTARERLGVEPIRIRAGHAPYVSRPGELAEILVGLRRPEACATE
jgi:pimeloyl-ACP methyl ester carboxylesterase